MDSIHSALYQNLRLLVTIFPNLDMENKLQKGMFKKPNTKGMQSVFYSLIMILNPEYCQKHVPWPVSFTSDNYKFRTAVINFIEKECNDFQPPKLLPSLLNKADGEKYVRFIFNFLTYVTKTMINRKYYRTLNEPNVGMAYGENLNLLDDATSNVYLKNKESKERHQMMMENSLKLKKLAENEMIEKSEELRVKKEEFHIEVENILSYTKINEDNMIEKVVSDYEHELREYQRNYYRVRSSVRKILDRKKKLLQLIYLKRRTREDLVDIDYFRSVFSEEFTKMINVPQESIKSTLFVESNGNSFICLKSFLHFALILLKSRMQRFLTSGLSEKHVTICQAANEIFTNTSKRFDDLILLYSKLDTLINYSKKSITEMKCLHRKSVTVNANYLNYMLQLKSYEKYTPLPLDIGPEKPLWLELPAKPKFSIFLRANSNEDTITQMRQIDDISDKSKLNSE